MYCSAFFPTSIAPIVQGAQQQLSPALDSNTALYVQNEYWLTSLVDVAQYEVEVLTMNVSSLVGISELLPALYPILSQLISLLARAPQTLVCPTRGDAPTQYLIPRVLWLTYRHRLYLSLIPLLAIRS